MRQDGKPRRFLTREGRDALLTGSACCETGLTLVAVTAIVLLPAAYFHRASKIDEVGRWKEAAGKVVGSKQVGIFGSQMARISYEAEGAARSKEEFFEAADEEKYAVGTSVKLWYKPGEPNQSLSVLELDDLRRQSRIMKQSLLPVGISTILALLMILRVRRRRRRNLALFFHGDACPVKSVGSGFGFLGRRPVEYEYAGGSYRKPMEIPGSATWPLSQAAASDLILFVDPANPEVPLLALGRWCAGSAVDPYSPTGWPVLGKPALLSILYVGAGGALYAYVGWVHRAESALVVAIWFAVMNVSFFGFFGTFFLGMLGLNPVDFLRRARRV